MRSGFAWRAMDEVCFLSIMSFAQRAEFATRSRQRIAVQDEVDDT